MLCCLCAKTVPTTRRKSKKGKLIKTTTSRGKASSRTHTTNPAPHDGEKPRLISMLHGDVFVLRPVLLLLGLFCCVLPSGFVFLFFFAFERFVISVPLPCFLPKLTVKSFNHGLMFLFFCTHTNSLSLASSRKQSLISSPLLHAVVVVSSPLSSSSLPASLLFYALFSPSPKPEVVLNECWTHHHHRGANISFHAQQQPRFLPSSSFLCPSPSTHNHNPYTSAK